MERIHILNRKSLISDWRKVSRVVFSGSSSITHAVGGFIAWSIRAFLWLGLESFSSFSLILTWGLFGWIMGMVSGAVTTKEEDSADVREGKSDFRIPRRIRSFAGNAAFSGIIIGALISVIYSLLLLTLTSNQTQIDITLSRLLITTSNPNVLTIFSKNTIIIVESITTGILFAVGVFLWLGGSDVIYYAALRIILWFSGDAPFNYGKFLDYTPNQALVRKSGSGHEFIHSYLLEYFAKADQPVSNADVKDVKGFAFSSLIIGVINLCSWSFPPTGFVLSLLGLVLGLFGLKSSQKAFSIIGIILSLFALVASLVWLLFIISKISEFLS